MAIVIPSKHIYEKDNDKVRDNKIDKVEIDGIRPYISVHEKAEVYSEQKEFSDGGYVEKSKNNISYELIENNVVNSYTVQFTIACVQVVYKKYVTKCTIQIPEVISNKVISAIYTGEDENKNPNILCTANCMKYEESDVRAFQTFVINPQITNTVVKHSGDIEYPFLVNKELPTKTVMDIPEGKVEYTHTFSSNYSSPSSTRDCTVKVDFTDDGTNLVTAEMQYDKQKKEYTCDLTVLAGYEIQKLSGTLKGEERASRGEDSDTMNLFGTGELYAPDSIKLSFDGDYITIDLIDKTITINGDGSHPISFEGNELMQTTNYVMENGTSKDYLTTAYGKTMDLYKNGKETATILCDIHDAEYWVTKNLTFEKQNPSRQTVPFYTTRLMDRADADYYFFEFYGYSVGAGFDSIYIVGIDGAEILQQRIDLTTGDFSCTGKVPKDASSASISVVCDKEEKYSANLHILLDAADNINPFEYLNGDATDDTITINGVKLNVADYDNEFILAGANDLTAAQFHALQKGVEKLRFATNKLCFNIGDIVIPMVYGANGVDKPMSKYKDGSPKKFQVQGVRVFYDGAVWQELTLQEFS